MKKKIEERRSQILSVLDRPKAIKEITEDILKKSGIKTDSLSYKEFMNEMNKFRYVVKFLVKSGALSVEEVESERSNWKKKLYMKK